MPVYKDENRNTWYCKFYYTDYTGARKQKCKRGFARKSDAQAFERDFLINMAGTPTMTFKMLRLSYMDFCSTRLKGSTLRTKKSLIENNIAPYFDTKQVDQITSTDISTWQDVIKEKGFTDTSLRQINGQLVAIFNYAVKYKRLPKSPCIETMGSSAREPDEIKFWTLDEYNDFISHVPDIEYYTLYELLYYTGCRIGELMALTLSDIDFKNNTMRIKKTFDYHVAQDNITTPKTKNSYRTVALPVQVVADLKEYASRVYDITPYNELFFLSYERITEYKNKVCQQYNINQIRLHDFRHSHVTLLIEMGVNIFLIAERIGDDVQTVQRTYAHLYPNKQQSLAEKLNNLVSK